MYVFLARMCRPACNRRYPPVDGEVNVPLAGKSAPCFPFSLLLFPNSDPIEQVWEQYSLRPCLLGLPVKAMRRQSPSFF